ncbi:MAG: paraquat-inducible protein A [Pseudomonadota bacterium]
MTSLRPVVTGLNLVLLVLFPISWFAPLLRAGLDLPLFGTREISVISGLQSLWETDVFLALLVTILAVFAPLMKTIGLALVHFGYMRKKSVPGLELLGKLAMADVFLIAIYVVVVKGVALTRIEPGWGLYLFTLCVILSMVCTTITGKTAKVRQN